MLQIKADFFVQILLLILQRNNRWQ